MDVKFLSRAQTQTTLVALVESCEKMQWAVACPMPNRSVSLTSSAWPAESMVSESVALSSRLD